MKNVFLAIAMMAVSATAMAQYEGTAWYDRIGTGDDSLRTRQNRSMFQTAINSSNLNYYQNLFKKRKDRFRRWRDLSFFVMAGIYGLSIVDAYVDASLSEFDITDDLSLQVAPAVLNNQLSSNPFRASAVGLQCCLNF